MSSIGWLLVAVGGVSAALLIWLMYPIIQLIFEWFAFLFRGLQMAPSWFRSAVWLFLGSFFMQMFVTFFIAGNVVCVDMGGADATPVRLTSFPMGYIDAAIAKTLPQERLLDGAVQSRYSGSLFYKIGSADLSWLPWWLGGSDSGGESDDTNYGTLLTLANDLRIRPAIQNANLRTGGVFFAPQNVDSLNVLFDIPAGKDLPISMSTKLYVCGVTTPSTSAFTYDQMSGQCAVLKTPCDQLTNGKAVASFVYSVDQREVTQSGVDRSVFFMRVQGVDGAGGLEYYRGGLNKDVYGENYLGRKMRLNNSCWPENGCTWSVNNSRYYIQLDNGDAACVEGEYRLLDEEIDIELAKNEEDDMNPRMSFLLNSGIDVSQEMEPPLPGITYACEGEPGKTGDRVVVRLFGLDVGNVTLFYIIFSVVGVVLLQRFMRNY